MQTTKLDPELDVRVHVPELEVREEAPGLIERLAILGEHKRFIVIFVGAATILAVIVSLLLPFTYEANTKIMPPQQNPSAASALMAQLGPLAAFAGKDLGLHSPSDLYVDMFRSRAVADGLIKRFSLLQYYKKKEISDAELQLAGSTEIIAAKDGVITISVRDREQQRAADLANGYVEELEKLSQGLGVTEAGRRRLFFEHEVQQVSDELAKAELELKQTQEKTGMIQLDSQARAMIDALVRVRTQVAIKEAQVQAMRAFATDKNPALMRAEQELAALRTQQERFESGQATGSIADFPVGKVPSAGLEYIRKLREVRYRESLLEALSKQYEIARIDEAKDASIIQTLDKAVAPTHRVSPRRTIIVLVTMFMAFFVALVYVSIAESLRRANEDPEKAAQLQRLKRSFRWRRNAD